MMAGEDDITESGFAQSGPGPADIIDARVWNDTSTLGDDALVTATDIDLCGATYEPDEEVVEEVEEPAANDVESEFDRLQRELDEANEALTGVRVANATMALRVNYLVGMVNHYASRLGGQMAAGGFIGLADAQQFVESDLAKVREGMASIDRQAAVAD